MKASFASCGLRRCSSFGPAVGPRHRDIPSRDILATTAVLLGHPPPQHPAPQGGGWWDLGGGGRHLERRHRAVKAVGVGESTVVYGFIQNKSSFCVFVLQIMRRGRLQPFRRRSRRVVVFDEGV